MSGYSLNITLVNGEICMLTTRYWVSSSVITDHRAPHVTNKLHLAELITALPNTVICHHDCLARYLTGRATTVSMLYII